MMVYVEESPGEGKYNQQRISYICVDVAKDAESSRLQGFDRTALNP